MHEVKIHNIIIGNGRPLVLIAGPCVVENREMIVTTARRIQEICGRHSVPVIFKSSYKKANRTSLTGFTGIGMDEALGILAGVRKEFDMPVLTDVHSTEEIAAAAQAVDVIQIPAFLCRQTDLLLAAGRTGKTVNIKKGQFLAPDDMSHPVEKVASTGNNNIMVTERGSTFGYHNLVVDMRGLRTMRSFGYPVILDATHSVQLPGAGKGVTGGEPEFIFPLARAGVAVGIDGLFVETHPNPSKALSDAASQLPLDRLDSLVTQVAALDAMIKKFPQ